MKEDAKLVKLKKSINSLIDVLRDEDVLSVIVFSNNPKILFSSTGHYNKRNLKLAINNLKAKGGTNTKKGLQKAYKLSKKYFITNGNNRIILATDGVFKLGRKDKKLIKTYAKKSVLLSVFHYNTLITEKKEQEILQKIAKYGQGNYKQIHNNFDAKTALINEAKQ
jgi:Ca-activated chloride channel family protein